MRPPPFPLKWQNTGGSRQWSSHRAKRQKRYQIINHFIHPTTYNRNKLAALDKKLSGIDFKRLLLSRLEKKEEK